MNTALFSGSDLDVVFSLVLTMSLSASWIAAAVLVLRLCLKRAPKWVNVLLWGIVAVRLMLPVSIESPLSLLPRTEAILPAVTAQPIQAGTAPAVGSAAAVASGAAMRSQPGLDHDPGVGLARGDRRAASVHVDQHAAAAAQGPRGRPPAGEHLRDRAYRLTVRARRVPAADLSALPHGQPRPGAGHRPRAGRICAEGITCGSRWAFCC